MLTNAIENAQKRVEGRNFNIRKHVLQYDDVMNKQREVIYTKEKSSDGENLKDPNIKMIEATIDNIINTYTGEAQHPDDWNIKGMIDFAETIFLPKGFRNYKEEMEDLTRDFKGKILSIAMQRNEERERNGFRAYGELKGL